MLKIVSKTCLAAATFACLGFLLLRANAEENHYIEFAQPNLVGISDEYLVSVVRAKTEPVRGPDNSGAVLNLREYALCVSISNTGDQATKVIGPLWSMKGPISSATLQTGADFPGTDATEQRQLRPFFSIAPDGKLMRHRYSPADKSTEISVLEINKDAAMWRVISTRPPLDLLKWPSTDFVQTRSGKFQVQKDRDGETRVYDLLNGKAVDDKWLVASFDNSRKIKGLSRFSQILTDDLNFYILFPARPLDPSVKETFELNGSTFPSKNHGIVYSRTESTPHIFEGLRSKKYELPLEPYSIDDRLLFLEVSQKQLSLLDISGKIVESYELPAGIFPSKDMAEPIVRHDLNAHQFVLIWLPDQIEEGRIRVLKWQYKLKKTQDLTFGLKNLFELGADGYYPVSATAIQN